MKRDRKEKFSIRKFSFGAASCLIGATIAMTSLSSKEVQAMSTTVVGDNGGTSVIYANWDDNPLKTNTNSSVSVNDEIVIKVDTSGYTKNRPIVTVTYYFNKNFMRNTDGSITPTGTNNNIVRKGEVSWLGHRPDYWFTVPKGFSEPTSIVLTNARGSKQYNNWAAWRNSNSRGVASRYQSEADAKAMNNGSPDNWSRYNDHTQEGPIWEHNGSLNWYLNTRAGYGWDDGSDKEAYERLRNNTRSIYSDWENTAAAGAEIQVTYEVKDPVNTQYIELGAGVHINAGGIDHIKIETIALPDVDDTPENQKYEPNKLPARQGVKDVTSLTPEEKTTLKEALKEKNPLLEKRLKGGLENGISIANDGTATFTYTDNTTDTIPGKDLVYKKFLLGVEPYIVDEYKYKIEQTPVDDYNNITDVDRKRADEKLAKLSGVELEYDKSKYPLGVGRSKIIADTNYRIKGPKNDTYAKWENGDNLRIGGKWYFGTGTGFNELIPKDVLFVQIPKADNNAKQKGKDLINGLQNLTDAEKDEYKKKIDQLPANSSEDKINEIVNEALKKDAENKALKEAKEEAKKVVAALPNLTNEEKDAAKREIDNAATTDVVTTAKNNAIAKDLEKEKDKAKKRIDQIKDNLANPDEYKNQIGAATTKDEIAAIVRRAEDEAAKKQVEKNKAEADTVRDEAKRKVDAIPGLTEAEKKHFKDLIDGANTKGQIDKIVEDAKQYADSKAKREAVKKEIENLPHLNKAQKADFIESINATDDIPTISDISTKAHNLDARMGRLQDLVEYAKGNEVTDKYKKSDSTKKQVFDEAKKAAEKIADKENATDNAGVDLVQKLYKDLEDAIKKLGIDPVVLKTNKDALKAEVALNDNDAIKKGNPYKLATSDEKRAAYDRAFKNAKDVLNKEQATQDEINQAVRDLQNARYALDGKVANFTLKTTGVAEISVNPQEVTTLTSDADKNLVKSKVRVTQSKTEGNVLDTDEVFYGNITSKDGKFYVPVTVGRDKVYHIVDVEVKEFTLAVKDVTKPAEISKTPVAGESLTAEDQAKVKEKVTANNEALKPTDTVAYGPIKEKDGKKVVPVTVTRDGVAKTVEVEVTKKAEEFTLAVKDATKPAEISKTPVAGESLTAEDQAKVKEKVTANNEALKPTDTVAYGPIKEKDGKKVVPVTVTRDGVAKTVEVLVVKKEDSTDSSGSQGNQDGQGGQGGSGSKDNQNGQGGQGGSGSQGNQNGQGGSGSQGNQNGQGGSGSQGNQNGQGGSGSQGNQNGQGGSGSQGNQNGQGGSGSQDKPNGQGGNADSNTEGPTSPGMSADQSDLDKAKDKAKSDLTVAANKEKAEIDADKNLTDKEKADKKTEVDKVKEEQEANIDKAQITDEVEKATEAGKKAIDAVHQTDLDKAKDKAKSDLTVAA
ncbi:YSIRK-type signal peptide-containing protein, partial [uncultured Gemella sp.]|uniref:YSIRK-type signal peptide-containing protein n=1 Tax=uncultured Gemella sp. TaxID=254352 RepID=UPI0028D3043B